MNKWLITLVGLTLALAVQEDKIANKFFTRVRLVARASHLDVYLMNLYRKSFPNRPTRDESLPDYTAAMGAGTVFRPLWS